MEAAIVTQPYQKPTTRWVKSVGIECELFAPEGSKVLFKDAPKCIVKGEAGKNTYEAITVPHSSLVEAHASLRSMFAGVDMDNLHFTAFRPDVFKGNINEWNSHPRYESLREALRKEKPGYDDWVDAMTNNAAYQINFGGSEINSLNNGVIFTIDAFNWLAPAIAALIHEELGYGQGHLAIWQKFADQKRFPVCNRWFGQVEYLTNYIQSLRKLFSLKENGEVDEVYPEQSLSIDCALDLTFIWWFLRPKISPTGERYLEVRYLPSMPLAKSLCYLQQTEDIFEVLLDWFYGPNNGQIVPNRQAAAPAFAYLVKELSCYEIFTPKNDADWMELFLNH